MKRFFGAVVALCLLALIFTGPVRAQLPGTAIRANIEERTIPHKSLLVFHNYGESYFLSEVVEGGEQTGRMIAPSRRERALEREMASTNAEPKTVTVALN